jgi:hypothetical protein
MIWDIRRRDHYSIDMRGDPRLLLHERMKISDVEYGKAGSGNHHDRGGAARTPQLRDLAKEGADAEADVLVIEINLDLPRNEIHRMGVIGAAQDEFAG